MLFHSEIYLFIFNAAIVTAGSCGLNRNLVFVADSRLVSGCKT